MQKPPQRNIDELLDAYRGYVSASVSKVHILGEAGERELREVFVELSIVDRSAPRQHAEFLGMMDSAMRRRFNSPADTNRDAAPDLSGQRRVRPDELLHRRTKAIITGAPGSGKTTLLKYLARKAQEQERRLAIWLELKAVDKPLFAEAGRVAAHDGTLILLEMWLKHLKAQLSLSDGEAKLLRAHWQERFKANEIAVFLDGFDELQDEAIERQLNKCVRQFASALHENTLLISTRPYAEHKLGKESLQELEIEPLNQHQIKAFLNCYYPNDDAIKSLLKTLRERSSLKELLHVPLLLGVILSLHREGRFTGERLKLYETIITDLVDELDRSKSINRQFRIDDERLRLDFLKFLAFERLLRDPLDEEEQEANRIVFSYDLVREKARIFLSQERLSHSARDLADDALATPLLRAVGNDAFAFTHLTLQEYLAARAFATFYKSNEFEGLKIFCRAYHNPTIVEMDVLPMALGATTNADRLYDEIENWPESLNLTNLRLRARGLSYSAKLNQERISKLIDQLLELILLEDSYGGPYLETVLSSFAGVNAQTMAFIETKANLSFRNSEFLKIALALGQLGSEKAIDALISLLHHENAAISQNIHIRRAVFIGLSFSGSDRATDTLISALSDEDSEVRSWALKGLIRIGSDKAIEALVSAVNHPDSKVRYAAILRLPEVDYDRVVDVVIPALNDEDVEVRSAAVITLASAHSDKALNALVSALNDTVNDEGFVTINLGLLNRSDKAIDALISALNDPHTKLRSMIATTFGIARSERAIGALISALNDPDRDVQLSAVGALGFIGSDRAVDALISALNDKRNGMRPDVAAALGLTNSDKAERALIAAQNDADSKVRLKATEALGWLESKKIVDTLISALDQEDVDTSSAIASALSQFDHDKSVEALVSALSHKDRTVRRDALIVLGYIGSDQAVEALIANLNNKDNEMLLGSALVLNAIRPDQAIELLTTALNDSDDDVRRNAVESLGAIGSDRAIDVLISALNHEDGEVSRKAAESLAQTDAKTLISGLERTVSQNDDLAYQKTIIAIGYHSNDKRTLDKLKQLSLKHQDSIVGEAAREAADKLARKLELLDGGIAEGTAQPLSDNESREGVLVGEVTKIIFEAGHIFRPTPNNDWGIDGEIEFKNEHGEASGQRVYLQLKSGDSYLRKRRMDGEEIFTIKNPRHAAYWQSHRYPVLLVIRDSKGRIRWMDVSEYLQHHGANVRQIEFQGEPFTTESVKQMRARFSR